MYNFRRVSHSDSTKFGSAIKGEWIALAEPAPVALQTMYNKTKVEDSCVVRYLEGNVNEKKERERERERQGEQKTSTLDNKNNKCFVIILSRHNRRSNENWRGVG